MACFIGAISNREPLNWDRCKEVGLWGVPRITSHVKSIKAGDQVFIWKSRVGFIAEAEVTGPYRVPTDPTETPWPGGLRRFSAVVPIVVVRETNTGYKLPFVRDKQEVTGITTNSLRFGLVPVTDVAGEHIREALRTLGSEEALQT